MQASAVRLCAVLNHRDAASDRENGGHVGRPSIEMRHDNGRRTAWDGGGINQQRPRIDVGEGWCGARRKDRGRAVAAGVRDRHDTAARTGAAGAECEFQGVGPIANANTVIDAAIVRKRLFETAHMRAELISRSRSRAQPWMQGCPRRAGYDTSEIVHGNQNQLLIVSLMRSLARPSPYGL